MRKQLALKPPFWLLSLPLFLVLYRNTASPSPQGEDDDCEGNLDDKRGDSDVEDEIVEGALNRGGRVGDDIEDKRDNVEGELVKAHHLFLFQNFSKHLKIIVTG